MKQLHFLVTENLDNEGIIFYDKNKGFMSENRGGSRTAATSKMEYFAIIVNG